MSMTMAFLSTRALPEKSVFQGGWRGASNMPWPVQGQNLLLGWPSIRPVLLCLKTSHKASGQDAYLLFQRQHISQNYQWVALGI